MTMIRGDDPIGGRLGALAPALAAILIATGCTTGLDSVLFMTKTSFGADLDSKPPTIDLGYARKEGIIAPVFENGRVLPVLSTIDSGDGVLHFSAEQSFATGDAALVMATAFRSEAEAFPSPASTNGSQWEGLDPWKQPKTNNASPASPEGAAALAAQPAHKPPPYQSGPNTIVTESPRKRGTWSSIKYFIFGDNERKRFFFGTDTSVGLQVSYNGTATYLPDALSFGWKRKELAYVPLIESDEDVDGNITVHLASLIATASMIANAAPTVEKSADTSVKVVQMYATGAAATLLAGHPGVRRVIGPKVIPDYDKMLADQSARQTDQVSLVNQIKEAFKAADATKQKAILEKAAALFPDSGITFDKIEKLDGVRQAGSDEVTKKLNELLGFAKSR